jgi:hypothetical protein
LWAGGHGVNEGLQAGELAAKFGGTNLAIVGRQIWIESHSILQFSADCVGSGGFSTLRRGGCQRKNAVFRSFSDLQSGFAD